VKKKWIIVPTLKPGKYGQDSDGIGNGASSWMHPHSHGCTRGQEGFRVSGKGYKLADIDGFNSMLFIYLKIKNVNEKISIETTNKKKLKMSVTMS